MTDATLYHFPASFYSLKVLFALYEKKVPFNERVVNIHGGDQCAPWFLRINKNGEVPVLQIGDRNVAESEDIIDVIDSTYTSGVRLQPDVGTDIGEQVADLRRAIQAFPIDVITFGVMANRQFCVSEIQMPKILLKRMTKEKIAANFSKGVDQYKKQLEICADDLRGPIQMKIKKTQDRRDRVLNAELVGKELDALEPIFDLIEDSLRRSGNDVRHGIDAFVFGSQLTAADVVVVNLMFRLEIVGVCARFASPEVRPLLYGYYYNIQQRPSVQKIKGSFKRAGTIHLKMALKRFGKTTLKVGFVVGLVALGYIGYKKYFK